MNIIVAGASRGIGFETVKALAARQGCQIIALARSGAALEQLRTECEGIRPDSVHLIAADLETLNIKEELLPVVQNRFRSVDILIHIAGVLVNKPIAETSDEDLRHIYGVNVFSMFRLVRDLLPLLEKSAEGAHIVTTGSMGGVQGSAKFPGLAAYSSSKGAVAILTECLAEELRALRIYVNCIAPGAVQTEMLGKAFPGYKAPVSAAQMGGFIADFALTGRTFFNGKIIPVSSVNP
jgi:NAD(P)-dependent dehydrogenase (short-subunit alcohol dehydrogenase family)